MISSQFKTESRLRLCFPGRDIAALSAIRVKSEGISSVRKRTLKCRESDFRNYALGKRGVLEFDTPRSTARQHDLLNIWGRFFGPSLGPRQRPVDHAFKHRDQGIGRLRVLDGGKSVFPTLRPQHM